jgi:hypothetical protein
MRNFQFELNLNKTSAYTPVPSRVSSCCGVLNPSLSLSLYISLIGGRIDCRNFASIAKSSRFLHSVAYFNLYSQFLVGIQSLKAGLATAHS